VTLLFIVGWILVEAVSRLLEPRDVMGSTMLLVASAGLVVNIIAFAVLHGGDRNNLNIRGAVLHVAGDLLGSVAAIVASVVIIYTGWLPIDPILSVAVAALILRSAWGLVKRSAHILLEGAPEWFNNDDLQSLVQTKVPAVRGVHHVHVWGLTPQELLLTMHVDVGDAEPGPIVREVKSLLRETYGIDHSTIEVEQGKCADH
jgi:cobalt-zinc-cadmium efflux system protein